MSDINNEYFCKKKFIIKNYLTEIIKNNSFFLNFISLVKKIISPNISSESKKSCIDEQKKHTIKTLTKLLHVKQELKSQVPKDLYKQIEMAIEPITRDAKRLQIMLAAADHNSESYQADKKFRQWITKAEKWVKLEVSLDLQVSIVNTILEQNFIETKELIDQDLQVIADYKKHLLVNLAVSLQEKESLKTFINQKLFIHIEELEKLKQKPELLDLHKIAIWKDQIDHKRAQHFENALHKIDAIIESTIPKMAPHTTSFYELDTLEVEAEKIKQDAITLIFDVKNQNLITETKKTTFLSRFQWLQQKTHQQQLDLHLPTEQSDRLGKITSVIDQINKKMKEYI